MIVQTFGHLSHRDLHTFLVKICVQRDKEKVFLNQQDQSLIKVKSRTNVLNTIECVDEENLKKIYV